MQWTPWSLSCWDQDDAVRRSKDRTWRAPLLTSSKQRAEPTNPSPPVTTKVFPSMPSFSLRCIFFLFALLIYSRKLSPRHNNLQVGGDHCLAGLADLTWRWMHMRPCKKIATFYRLPYLKRFCRFGLRGFRVTFIIIFYKLTL